MSPLLFYPENSLDEHYENLDLDEEDEYDDEGSSEANVERRRSQLQSFLL